jgi:glycerol-3-phosphate acyltransferase PlsY
VLSLQLFAGALVGYLIGSVSFAIVVSRLFGLADPRSYGSHNPGATNVLRSGSKAAALLTLAGDALKGAVAVWLVRVFGAQYGVGEAGAVLAGLGAFIGHLYPVFFRFAGGKGVATFFGVVLAFNPWLALAAGGIWVAMAALFRYSSLASLTAAVAAPLLWAVFWSRDLTLVALIAMAALLIFRHRENIAKLRAGTESKLGGKRAA